MINLDPNEYPSPARYSNPWHSPGRPEYGPETFVSHSVPTHHRGFEVYVRSDRGHRDIHDIVKDGRCVGQYAGPNGACQAIDDYLDDVPNTFSLSILREEDDQARRVPTP